MKNRTVRAALLLASAFFLTGVVLPRQALAAETNVALNKAASADSEETTFLTAAKAFDGDSLTRNSRWASDPDATPAVDGGPHWLAVDLGSERMVTSLQIIWEQRKAKSYKIQVANGDSIPAANSADWQTVYANPDRPATVNDAIQLDAPVKARFVRLWVDSNSYKDPDNGTHNGNWGAVSVYEMEVYADTDAEAFTPSTEQVTVDKDAVVSPADGISNKDDLPTGTTFAWKPGHDPVTSQPGDTVGTVIVTYPDGTTEEVTVAVHVRSDAENNAPAAQPLEIPLGSAPDPAVGISNKDDLPAGTTFAWKTGEAPDTSVAGNTVGTVVVTYPDGSTDEVTVPVRVIAAAEINAPVGNDLTTDQGFALDPSTAIANKGDLPTGTTFSWKPGHAPDTSVPGDKTAVIVVTYPDGSTDEVTITVHVNAPAEKPAEDSSQAVATGANKKKHGRARALPKTGDAASFAVLAMGASGSAAAIGAAIKRRKRS